MSNFTKHTETLAVNMHLLSLRNTSYFLSKDNEKISLEYIKQMSYFVKMLN